VDGVVVYPFDLSDLAKEGVSVGQSADPRTLARFGVYHVHLQDHPPPVPGVVSERDALQHLAGGFWMLGYTGRDQTADELADERVQMVVSRLQGRLALGEEICGRLDAIAADPKTHWNMREVINGAPIWRRTSQEMEVLGYALGYTPEQMDALFRAALATDVLTEPLGGPAI